jgi:Family of unknown function (DUF6011)
MQATQNLDDINAALQEAAMFDAEARDVAPVALRPAVHPFQRAGLGRGPFRCTGVDDAGSRDEQCSFCTTAIRYVYHIEGADGSRFQVGSECVKQTGGEVAGFETFNRQMTARIRQLQGEARKVREATKAASAAQAWKDAHANEWAYMQQRAANGNGFYSYLVGVVEKFGNVFESRMVGVRADMARDAAPVAAQAPRPVPPVVNIAAVESAFASASAAGITWPKLRLGAFVFSPAGTTSANAGGIYVKTRTPAGDLPGVYLGKVLGGKFFKSRDCDAQAEAEVVAVCADPKAAAVAYGRKFGRCSVCNRELSDAASVEAGIGPICASKYGF